MAVTEQRAALSMPCCILIRSMMIYLIIGVKEGIGLSATFILSSFAFACACSFLTVIEECRPIRSFLVRKRLDFPDLKQVVPSNMADAVRKKYATLQRKKPLTCLCHCLACLAWQSLEL